MMITKVITRRLNFGDHNVWFTSNSSLLQDYINKWSNTLYIHFAKESFPFLVYPKLEDVKFIAREKSFQYMRDNDLADLSWHGGITFYEEIFNPEFNKTFVKAGCDYQHYMDDHWMLDDNGEYVLKMEAPGILKEFLEIVELRKKA